MTTAMKYPTARLWLQYGFFSLFWFLYYL